MSNLPEQAHAHGTAVAVRQEDDPYALDATDVILPRLRVAQYQSQAFKSRIAGYGDLVVGFGKEDPNPVVVAKGGEPLGEPLRFYVHRIYKGYNVREDPTDKRLTFGRLGEPYGAALLRADGDPRRVFQKHDYLLTIPAYPDLPVRFLMTSKWGGPAAMWMNSQISIARQKGQNPLEIAFQVQTKPDHNDQGDFAVAVVGIANVKAKDAKADAEIVARHAQLSQSANLQADLDEVEEAREDEAAATQAPSLG